ncbi:MAG: hypothetical protein Q4D57_04580 [Clostridia bacterium]|nr:hypothetical protein [Clostridia bacterium]
MTEQQASKQKIEYTNCLKKIEELVYDRNRTESLLREGKLVELQEQIKSVVHKNALEAVIYNSVNTELPSTLQQNGMNCINFLNKLIEEKTIEKLQYFK